MLFCKIMSFLSFQMKALDMLIFMDINTSDSGYVTEDLLILEKVNL